MPDKQDWRSITPAEAARRFGGERGALGSGLVLPRNEEGEECPWPWDPIQLKGYPIGQYHCPYCGAMVMAGIDHVDYGVLQEVEGEGNVQQ